MNKLPERILYVDLETTGLDEKVNGVIQIAAIYEVNDKEVDRFSAIISPGPTDIVEDQALAKNGRKREELYTHEQPVVTAAKFHQWIGKYVQPFVTEDKVYFCAYNADFDFKFWHAFLRRYSTISLGNYCFGYKLDPYMLAIYLRATGRLITPNLQLSTLTTHYNIKHSSQHDAISDIEAARDLFKHLHQIMEGNIK